MVAFLLNFDSTQAILCFLTSAEIVKPFLEILSFNLVKLIEAKRLLLNQLEFSVSQRGAHSAKQFNQK